MALPLVAQNTPLLATASDTVPTTIPTLFSRFSSSATWRAVPRSIPTPWNRKDVYRVHNPSKILVHVGFAVYGAINNSNHYSLTAGHCSYADNGYQGPSWSGDGWYVP